MSTAATPDDVTKLADQGTILINGEWRKTGSAGMMDHINPATGKAQAAFAVGGRAEIDEAVRAAKAAFPAWRKVKADVRRDILNRFAGLLEQHKDKFNRVAALETGVPISGFPIINLAIDQVKYAAGWCDKIEGQITPTYPFDALNMIHHEPYGVIGAITTWNGPVAAAMMKSAPALAAGNTVVVKPPELGPFGTALVGRLAQEAGIPPGVLNIVSGAAEAGEALVRHPDVAKVSFTGSIPVAEILLKAAAEQIKPMVLELGGKSANIVFDDADLDQAAVMAAYMSAVQLAGQGCLFPTRLLVQDSVYDAMVERVLAHVKGVKIGNPLAADTMMGPVISQRAVDRIMGYIDHTVASRDGKLLTGGKRVGGDLADGYFIEPTVFGDVDNRSRLAQEEVFGPVLSIIRFKTEEEALALANDTRYGLAGYVHTNDLGRAHRVAGGLEAGYIGVNAFPSMAATAPFGGWKHSGYGREGGRISVEEFLRPKNIHIALPGSNY